MKIGIYGAGSLGIVLGAYITKAGTEIDLINRNREQVDALNTNGAKIVGKAELIQPVHAILPEEMSGTYDMLFLLTKQLHNREVASFLKPYLAGDGVLVTLQNGLPEPELAEILGGERVMGCTVEWGATLRGPGISELTSEPDTLSFGLGRYSGEIDEKLRQAERILSLMCPVVVEENFMGVRWAKLLINAAFSGMGTVLGTTFGGAAGPKESRKCVQGVIKECIDVAHAAGVEIAQVQGKDIVALLNYNGPIRKFISNQIIPIAIKKHSQIKPSMLQDLEQGKLTEVDAINGVVCTHGKELGVPTPFNDAVVSTIHAMERGDYPPSFDNLRQFSHLI